MGHLCVFSCLRQKWQSPQIMFLSHTRTLVPFLLSFQVVHFGEGITENILFLDIKQQNWYKEINPAWECWPNISKMQVCFERANLTVIERNNAYKELFINMLILEDFRNVSFFTWQSNLHDFENMYLYFPFLSNKNRHITISGETAKSYSRIRTL